MSDLIVRTEHLTKVFPGVRALDDVSMDIRSGQILGLCGENGAGKSTFMNVVTGAYAPTSGRLLIDDEEVVFGHPIEAQQRGIAMIHQELSLSPSLSVAENVFVGRLPRNRLGFVEMKRAEIESHKILSRIGAADLDPSDLIKDLTASQMQLVEIAKALSLDARILIMDEPTSSLTRHETDLLLSVMTTLRDAGTTIVFVSHRLDEVMEVADAVSVMRDGRHVSTKPSAEHTVDTIITDMVGRPIESIFSRHRPEVAEEKEVVLRVDGLSDGGRVKDVSFDLYRGEILAITGLVGAGRTELVQSIFGADSRTGGTVTIDNQKIEIKHPADAIRARLALVPEGRKTQGVFLDMSVAENITIASLPRMSAGQFVRADQERSQSGEMITKIGVKTAGPDVKIRNLSGGNQQKAVLARWLLTDPNILILDEPTQGIDVRSKLEIYKLLDEVTNRGISVIMVSSDLLEVLHVADRILVMHNGTIKGELRHDEADQEKIMRLATNTLP